MGDRLWAVYDPDGRFGSGKTTSRFRRMPGLLELRAAYHGDVPVISFPDGTSLRGDDPEVHAALSAHVGRPVSLRPEGAVPHADEGPIHLVTTASLRASANGTPVDARRARANLVLDLAGEDERTWVGRTLRVGDAVLEVTRTPKHCLGVYADVRRAGAVTVGDPVLL